jgi:hypothetical protein
MSCFIFDSIGFVFPLKKSVMSLGYSGFSAHFFSHRHQQSQK